MEYDGGDIDFECSHYTPIDFDIGINRKKGTWLNATSIKKKKAANILSLMKLANCSEFCVCVRVRDHICDILNPSFHCSNITHSKSHSNYYLLSLYLSFVVQTYLLHLVKEKMSKGNLIIFEPKTVSAIWGSLSCAQIKCKPFFKHFHSLFTRRHTHTV